MITEEGHMAIEVATMVSMAAHQAIEGAEVHRDKELTCSPTSPNSKKIIVIRIFTSSRGSMAQA